MQVTINFNELEDVMLEKLALMHGGDVGAAVIAAMYAQFRKVSSRTDFNAAIALRNSQDSDESNSESDSNSDS